MPKKQILYKNLDFPEISLMNVRIPFEPVANPEGAVWGNCPPKRLWRPLAWLTFAINASLFGAHGSRNRDK